MLEHLNYSLIRVAFGSLATLIAEAKIEPVNHSRWRLGNRSKTLLTFVIITALSISCFGFLAEENKNKTTVPQSTGNPETKPSETAQENNTSATSTNTPGSSSQNMSVPGPKIFVTTPAPTRPPGTFESHQTMDESVWWQVAVNAWQYFSPGVGVDRTTGLPWAGQFYSCFTDWDLGIYIQAVLDASAIGLIGEDGDWGASARLEKVMSFLENRDLNDYGYPYWFYQSGDGKEYRATSEQASSPFDLVDTGRLFVALNNLKVYNSSLASRIDALVTGPGNRSDYAALLPSVLNESLTSVSIYMYYITCGFASFWPSELGDAPKQDTEQYVYRRKCHHIWRYFASS